ncbi:hypothetical protein D3C86_1690290 [compost metagenome]
MAEQDAALAARAVAQVAVAQAAAVAGAPALQPAAEQQAGAAVQTRKAAGTGAVEADEALHAPHDLQQAQLY